MTKKFYTTLIKDIFVLVLPNVFWFLYLYSLITIKVYWAINIWHIVAFFMFIYTLITPVFFHVGEYSSEDDSTDHNSSVYFRSLILIVLFGTIVFFTRILVYFLMLNEKMGVTDLTQIKSVKACIGCLCIIIGILANWALVMWIYPIIGYKFFHFGWIIAIYICLIGASVYFAIFLFVSKAIKVSNFILLLVALVLVFALGIFVMTTQRSVKISKPTDFATINNIPRAGYRDYYLTNDIDFNGKGFYNFDGYVYSVSDYIMYKPINLYGTFDGNGYTISNMNSKTGLTGINHGIIRNIKFNNVIVDNGSYGIVADKNRSDYNSSTVPIIENITLENCTILSEEIGNPYTMFDNEYIGGITGKNEGIIRSIIVINIDKPLFIPAGDNIYGYDATKYHGFVAGYSGENSVENVLVYIDNSDETIGKVCANKQAIMENCYIFKNSGKPYSTQDELPEEISHWLYSDELGFFVPYK